MRTLLILQATRYLQRVRRHRAAVRNALTAFLRAFVFALQMVAFAASFAGLMIICLFGGMQ